MADVRAMYLRWHARVLVMARQILVDADEADEVAQEVFVEAWRRLEQYDAARGSEWAWLRTMTRTRCLDCLRSAERRRRAMQSAANADADTESDDSRSDVSSLLGRLPELLRIPIELSYLLGLTHREIAARTGAPLGTIKTRIRIGLARLAASLQLEGKQPALSLVREAGKQRA